MIAVVGVLLLSIVFSSMLSRKFNVPLIIISLTVGVLFGSDVSGIIYFDDTLITQRIANIALLFILFAGGFNTKYSNLHSATIRPALLLSTIGVLLTAVLAALAFNFLTDWSFLKSLILCLILSSTDAAAVFSILRSRQIHSFGAQIAEIESAANDPMAIISVLFGIQLFLGNGFNSYVSVLIILWQLVGGAILGILIGNLASYFFNKIRNCDLGYYYLFLIGVILLSFGLPDLINASGMVSVFIAGLVFGNKKIPSRTKIASFTDTLAFISNTGLFVLLGLLVFPKQFSNIWLLGLILFIAITFIARPISVFVCTFSTRLLIKEKLFLSWGGIKGAVPIVLATYPLAYGIDENHEILNIVFFVVFLSLFIQGTTIGKLADFFKLSSKKIKELKPLMDLVTIQDTNYELITLHVDENIYTGQCKVSDFKLPSNTTISMVTRNNAIIAPSGGTIILPGDYISILVNKDNVEDIASYILSNFNKN